jgi:hypothetical protein
MDLKDENYTCGQKKEALNHFINGFCIFDSKMAEVF